MNRLVVKTLCGGALLLAVGCGAAPQPFPVPSESVQQHFTFTAVAEPAARRFQIVREPQPVLAPITQDKNGDPATAASATVQIYSSNVAFTSVKSSYPPGCSLGSAQIMFADVDLLTGFNEMLRNVYVRITSVSGGQTFCGTSDGVGTFGASLSPNIRTYNYLTLDKVSAARAHRSIQWGLQLPDNGAFWFGGELWAEIIPALPTVSTPANGAVFNQGNSTAEVPFLWVLDGTANGGTLPTNVGAQLTILRCNALSTGAYNPAACTTTFLAPTVMNKAEYKALAPVGYWYQWSLRSAFRLPGQTTTTIGSLVATSYFSAN